MKKRLFLILSTIIIANCFSQTTLNLSWVYGFGSAVNEAISSSEVDAAGNVYITGEINSTLDFDPGPGTYTLTASSKAFFAKYNSSGALVWAHVHEGSGTSVGSNIRIDASNNVYLTGNFNGDIDFDPSVSTTSLTSVADIFIAKYTSAGTFTWAKGIGGGSAIAVNSNNMHVNAAGDIFIAGDFDGVVDFDASAATYTLAAGISNNDGYLLKYDNAGNFSWVNHIGNSLDNDVAYGVSEDASGNVFVTGAITDVIDFDPSAATATLVSVGQEDIYIAKYSSTGNYIWAKSFGGANKDQGYRIKLTSAGDVLITGNLQSPVVNFDPIGTYTLSKVGTGTNDSYIAKYSGSNGNFLWAKCTGGVGDLIAYNITLDSQDNIYLCGAFTDTVDLDYSLTGTVNYTAVTVSSSDIFLSKYSPSGDFIFANQLGGGSNSGNVAFSIKVDVNNDIILAGTYRAPIDFDFSATTNTVNVYGQNDIFFAKYSQCISPTTPTLSTTNATICEGKSYTLSLSGTLNSATNWYWSDVACGSSTLGLGTSIVVSPTTNTQYYVRANGGCITPTSCVTASITVNPSKNLIGQVTTNTINPVAGDVVLYKFESFLTKFDSITSQPLSPTGTFTFSSINSNSYILQCIPTNSTLQTTYSPNAISWFNAGVINHGCVITSTQNINVIPLTNLGPGTGVLSGQITEGIGYGQKGNGILVPGAPIKGVSVKGGRNPGGDITAQSRTNASGQFTLSGFPVNQANEDYFILVDIPGLDTNTTYHRVITLTNSEFTNLDFVVDSAKINPIYNFVGINKIFLDKNKISLYPNPTNGIINLEFELNQAANITIEICDILGKKIKTILPSFYQQETDVSIKTDLGELESGVYFIKIRINTSEITTKLIITK
ncbi:MAG: T9SS type A sorting domain-containing protein [Bacteroidota bacterium]|nr:T9SS type A sorting domain-containing protein [Bacteroidota bacterium]